MKKIHLFLFFLAFIGLLGAEGIKERTYSIYQAFAEQRVQWPRGILNQGGELFVLDSGNHRVIILGPEGLRRQIGQIGQEAGDLQSPLAFALDSQDRLWILDAGNQRIQIFSLEGRPLGSLPIASGASSIAVDPSGNLLLNSPGNGSAVLKLSSRGRVKGTLGELAPVSAGYPERSFGGPLTPLFGRVILVTDAEGVYMVHRFMPLVRKYSYSGELLWERRLEGRSVLSLSKTFWREEGAEDSKSSQSFDGVQGSDVITAGTMSHSGNLLVGLADGVIHVLSSDGKPKAVLRPTTQRVVFLDLTQCDDGVIYFVNPIQILRTEKPVDF